MVAAARVFAIPELLETILLKMPMSDRAVSRSDYRMRDHIQQIKHLFRLQRVDTIFQRTVQRSQPLRSAMFLEHTYEGLGSEGDDHPAATFNPLTYDVVSIESKHVSDMLLLRIKLLLLRRISLGGSV